jgi:hypothetical protein
MYFIFKNSVPLSKRTHSASTLKANKLVLLREMVAIFAESHETHKYTVVENTEFLNVIAVGLQWLMREGGEVQRNMSR